MGRVTVALLIAACAFGAVAERPRMLMGRMRGSGNKLPVQHDSPVRDRVQELASGIPGVGEGYMDMIKCHFGCNNGTWQQHYFFNTRYYRPGGPIFLMIGGEGPESEGWVTNEQLPYIGWAKQFGAAIYDLEHRFYGKSRPTDDMSDANIHLLSSRQAIEDIADFIREVNKIMGYDNAQWVTFGGSYSGALSLWARQAHPELIAGAVGSSGPVEAKMDFYQYLQVVEASLRTYDANCALQVKNAFDLLQSLMATQDGRDQINKALRVSPALTPDVMDYNLVQSFYSSVFGAFQGAVQYSGDNAGPFLTAYGIPQVCKMMTNASSDLLTRLDNVIYYMNMDPSLPRNVSLDVSYTELVAAVKSATSFDSDWAGERAWMYQTCTEFGYFQSTDMGTGIFGPVTPNNLYINMCQDIFGAQFTANYIAAKVNATLEHYGGADNYKGTNVVIPNGSLDPWHALGKYTSDDYSVVYFLMNGTAHCADMYPVAANGPSDLNKVHALIANQIERWLKGVSSYGPMMRAKRSLVEEKQQQPETLPEPVHRHVQMRALSHEELHQQLDAEPKMTGRFNKQLYAARPHKPLPPKGVTATPPGAIVQGWIRQPWCHFNNHLAQTFMQQFWVNNQWARPGGPHFLMIGGEGPESPRWVQNGDIAYLQWAKEFGATVYLLEHRYYGKSVLGNVTSPADDPNPAMLFLSAWQMLYDVADFVKTMNRQQGLVNPKWFTFGGSYSGSLSLWTRQQFPDLVYGAVGSSGPVQAKMDFYEYLQVTEDSMRGYSDVCAENTRIAFEAIYNMSLTAAGRVKLSKKFSLVPAWSLSSVPTPRDMQYFFQAIYGNFQGAVQYSGDNTNVYAKGYGIPEMCGFMTNATNAPIDNVAAFNVYMTEMYTGAPFNETGTDISYDNYITFLKNASQSGAGRYWTYQTCTEYGYFQSTDYGKGIFGATNPVNNFVKICEDVFGKTVVDVEEGIQRSLLRYGGRDHYKGTRVVAPNGSLDPWHALGMYKQPAGVTTILINGTAHCADMYPPREQDVAGLSNARATIRAHLQAWINGEENPSTTTPGTTSSSSGTAATTPGGGSTSTVGGSTTTVGGSTTTVGGSTTTVGGSTTTPGNSINSTTTTTTTPATTTTKSAFSMVPSVVAAVVAFAML